MTSTTGSNMVAHLYPQGIFDTTPQQDLHTQLWWRGRTFWIQTTERQLQSNVVRAVTGTSEDR
jgi:hypothetical protein